MENNIIKDTFDRIHAEESLKSGTKEFLAVKTAKAHRHRTAQKLLPALICVLLIFMGFGGYKLYFTETSVISIDINPSVELGVNRFNKVISLEGYNEDGRALAASLDIQFMDYENALEKIFSSSDVAEYLSEGEIMSVTVVSCGAGGGQSGNIEEYVRKYTEGSGSTYCYSATQEEVEGAHECGLSYGKYMAFLKLKSLSPDTTPQDVQDMTMREIRDLISSLTDGAASGEITSGGQGNGHGSENSSGNGGHRHGRDENK